MSSSFERRLAAVEANLPGPGLRVVRCHEDLGWTPEQREAERLTFVAGLPSHRGLTVVIRRFAQADA